ncbi:MAG: 2-dehydro-3-deoxyphosphogluconate aldolase / (4S)-4-hydroxy-2-oxoglutarate aldolase [Pseudonocardiales bacterium]|jgi:2-dehydro-3-deoxyphosphogluconate aldolase/(4S)-4-hydroxy-2-oxoglutarate aldolase|nr:2-dehydro-3-deoxyphosphogluconate aldolase / (4S)-4-hydroxy-2-oxoglutarate aldolase [Pseudonocardiales bacterium]
MPAAERAAQQIIEALTACPVLPVTVVHDARHARPLANTLAASGLTAIEITLRTPSALAAIENIAEGTGLVVGAGTVVSVAQIDDAVAAGARFVVTPGFDRRLVERCRELAIPIFPGIATATDVMAAIDEQLEILKFFPAEQLGGMATIRALNAPFPTIRFIPTGGITPALLPGYLSRPEVLAVGGSWMVDPSLVADEDWSGLAQLASGAMRLATTARAGS